MEAERQYVRFNNLILLVQKKSGLLFVTWSNAGTPEQSETETTQGSCACVTDTQPGISRSVHISPLHHTDQILNENPTRFG